MGEMSRAMLVASFLLALFGIGGATMVALTRYATVEQIAMNERESLLREIRKLIPAETIDNDIVADTTEVSAPEFLGVDSTLVYRGRKDTKPVAAVLAPVHAKGYAGPIKLLVAVKYDGTLGGVRVISHTETPGLGDKADENKSDWILGFAGKSLGNPSLEDWKVKKDGGKFDQFTGATITPRKIVEAVRKTLEYVERERARIFAEAPSQVSTSHSNR